MPMQPLWEFHAPSVDKALIPRVAFRPQPGGKLGVCGSRSHSCWLPIIYLTNNIRST